MAAYACVCAGCANAIYPDRIGWGGLLASGSPVAQEQGPLPLPGDDALESVTAPRGLDAMVLNGGGNGVGASRLAVTQFDIATEGGSVDFH